MRPFEAEQAYQIGLRRSAAAKARGSVHRFGWSPDPEAQRHVDGMSAVAEWVVAQHLGLEWTSQGLTPDAPEAGDIEGGISVRWTPRATGSLIVHEDEPDLLRCVLVVNEDWPLRIAGWLPASRAKDPEWWRTDVRHPAFFVPQAALFPL